MKTPAFFADTPVIEMSDPLAQRLGAVSDGRLTYTYTDAVKLAGHSCPTLAGAFLMTRQGPLMQALLAGQASPEEVDEFGGLWQSRVGTIMTAEDLWERMVTLS